MDIRPLSECSIVVVWGNEIDPALTPAIAGAVARIRSSLAELVTDVVPSYTTVTVYYDPVRIDFRRFIIMLRPLLEENSGNHEPPPGRRIELPVWYHPDAGPDLPALARACGLSIDDVIERHTTATYQVYALGFSPGFGFLGQVDPTIARPRLESPRVRVPAGSVGIAGRQTAVYPSASPGGWQLIGRCPVRLFDEQNLALLSVGDQVTFRPVDRQAFLELGGDALEAADRGAG
ncbi:sensor histidine kinase inhibitor, KipI family [Marinobacter daqiaonensis]|uniref:Sensor histidine kinase inhibitor, KipI family n=1 Tax=Marinobacter daqiaonensis TaxID=650891 RepID=A0A1I6GU41_9GAMM|nr:5-oxoprolinase subunit PxpB [Marinobacter daqiaonensis]SFR45722.1 sensor histidine kinase inhibitor, KipI family [Marinobacter daqiaonensis]